MSSNTQPALTGSCQCGAVKYSSTKLPSELTNYHCITCRKLSGGPYLTFGAFETSSLAFNSSPSSMKTTQYSAFATRTHCVDCGSPISMQYMLQPGRIGLTAGTFHDVKGSLPKIGEHIFLKEKAPWFEVPEDGIPRYEGFPEEFGQKVEDWVREQASAKS